MVGSSILPSRTPNKKSAEGLFFCCWCTEMSEVCGHFAWSELRTLGAAQDLLSSYSSQKVYSSCKESNAGAMILQKQNPRGGG